MIVYAPRWRHTSTAAAPSSSAAAVSDGPTWRTLADLPAPKPNPVVVPIAVCDYDPTEQLRGNLYQDTLLTFNAFAERTKLQATVEADPLGDVNRIVRLWRLNHDGTRTQLRAVLHRVVDGATLKVAKGYPIGHRVDPADGHGVGMWALGFDQVWIVEVDGRRVIEVPHFDAIEPAPPLPPIPWRRRVRNAVNRRKRSTLDAIARPFGYHHSDDCPPDDY
jgi:hypothetical protein